MNSRRKSLSQKFHKGFHDSACLKTQTGLQGLGLGLRSDGLGSDGLGTWTRTVRTWTQTWIGWTRLQPCFLLNVLLTRRLTATKIEL